MTFPRLILVATISSVLATPLPRAETVGDLEIEDHDRGTVSRVTLPGKLKARALPRDASGKRTVVVLVGPAEKPTDSDSERPTAVRGEEGVPEEAPEEIHLYRFDSAHPGPIERLEMIVPEGTQSLAAVDLDGDGRDEIILSGKKAIFVLDPDDAGSFVMRSDPLLTTDEIGTPGSGSLEIVKRTGRLCVALPGSLRCYGHDEDDGVFGLQDVVALPVKARHRQSALSLRSPAVVTVDTPDRRPLLATAPEVYGYERLRTHLIDAERPGEGTSVECWARFPGSEEMLDYDFMTFGDRTALVVANRRADKLALLGEKLLRVYFPEPDRTRRGRPPAFAVESRINLWQSPEFMALDVTGDGRRDLVVGYWKGLQKDRVVLDVYASTEDGGFDDSPRTTTLDIKKGDRGFLGYGSDLTGDGLYDLVVLSQKHVLIFPGQAKPGDGSDLVSSKPLFAPPRKEAEGGEVEFYVGAAGSGGFTMRVKSRPRIEDLDGDGAAELLLIGEGDDGNSVLTIVRLQ